MKDYSEADIHRAVEEVIAAGMEKFLYQEPFSSKRSRQSNSRKCSLNTRMDRENDE
ncbi:hypothetical protein V7149_25725 [Bacillus sp. JJ1503]|uniref:CotG/ExsB N-terminal domain-containing protein n=1 Tax=Bacillus sp. JJ1503 TaxID=3122956 RepID=UPI0030005C24